MITISKASQRQRVVNQIAAVEVGQVKDLGGNVQLVSRSWKMKWKIKD